MSIDPSFLHHRQKTRGDGREDDRAQPRLTLVLPASCSPLSLSLLLNPEDSTYRRIDVWKINSQNGTFCSFLGPAGTLETVRKGRSPRRSRIKRRTWQEGRPRVFQDQARRWPRVISRRRRRRSTTRPFNTPWIATRNVSTFTFYCSLFARSPLPLSPRFTTLKTRTPRLSKPPSLHRFLPSTSDFPPTIRAASASLSVFILWRRPIWCQCNPRSLCNRPSIVTEDRRTAEFYRPPNDIVYKLVAN